MGAAPQGWDQTGSNGANLSFPQEFGLTNEAGESSERDEWIIGLINSVPYLAAGLIGCWLSDPLNHYLGRRGEIFLTGIFLIATPIGSGLAQNWYQLFIIRFLMGVA
jgi:MFS family permease